MGVTSWLYLAAAGLLGAVLLWGLISPRTQWRVLVGWSTADPDRAEPGDGIHGIRRVICLIGLLALLAVGGLQVWNRIAAQPQPALEPTAVERMWGDPAPRLVDRVVVPYATPPVHLAAGPVAGYQDIDRGWAPSYLVSISHWSFLGEPEPAGLVGAYPGDGYTGYGISDLVVAAQGPLNCIPRLVSAVETDEQVQLGVYWGLPGPDDQGHLGACAVQEGQLLQTVLVPVQLRSPVGDRQLVTFDGVPVAPVPLIED